ncbi:hypothetical protein Hdeb2414_s0001g00015931 [Helianthus debilis subsp. tardiflorus]
MLAFFIHTTKKTLIAGLTVFEIRKLNLAVSTTLQITKFVKFYFSFTGFIFPQSRFTYSTYNILLTMIQVICSIRLW